MDRLWTCTLCHTDLATEFRAALTDAAFVPRLMQVGLVIGVLGLLVWVCALRARKE